jgi:hypothetical protein
VKHFVGETSQLRPFDCEVLMSHLLASSECVLLSSKALYIFSKKVFQIRELHEQPWVLVEEIHEFRFLDDEDLAFLERNDRCRQWLAAHDAIDFAEEGSRLFELWQFLFRAVDELELPSSKQKCILRRLSNCP